VDLLKVSYSEVIIIFPNFPHIKLIIHRSRVLAGHGENRLHRLVLKNPCNQLTNNYVTITLTAWERALATPFLPIIDQIQICLSVFLTL